MAIRHPARASSSHPRREPAPGGDGGIERHRGPRGAEDRFFAGRHAAAVRGHQALGEEPLARQVLGGEHPALSLHGRHLAPDLVQVDRRQRPLPFLKPAEPPEEPGRAEIGRPGGDAGGDAPVTGPVPPRAQVRDAREAELRLGVVHRKRARETDGRARTIPGALAQEQPKPGVGQRRRVAVETGVVLENQRGPRADRLQGAEQRHHLSLLAAERGQGQAGQAAEERRPVRGRLVLVDAPGDRHRQVGVGVGEAREDGAPAPVDPFRGGVARDDLGRGADGGDPVALDQDRGLVVDGLGDVAADHGGVVDERGHDSL